MSRPLIAVSDIHGYVDETLETVNAAHEYVDEGPLIEHDGDSYSWGDGEYGLLINGDLLDRGPQNEEALEMVGDLLDDDPDRLQYTLGNHEMFAMFPDLVAEYYADGDPVEEHSFWYDMDDEQREQLLTHVTEGDIEPAIENDGLLYVHGGTDGYPEIDDIAYTTRRMGASLLQAFRRGDEDFRQVQQDFFQRKPEPRKDIDAEGIYDDLLGVERTEDGDIAAGSGLVWERFHNLPLDVPAQVVGHTRGEYLSEELDDDIENPTQHGNAVNINTVRDMVTGHSDHASVLVDDDDGYQTIDVSDGVVVDEREHSFAVGGRTCTAPATPDDGRFDRLQAYIQRLLPDGVTG